MRKIDANEIFNSAVLLERLGPAPTISRVAHFLQESPSTTWRRVKDGQLKALSGDGTIRINLNSLAAFLNGGHDYELRYERGRKPRVQKAKAAGAK